MLISIRPSENAEFICPGCKKCPVVYIAKAQALGARYTVCSFRTDGKICCSHLDGLHLDREAE
jgi:hypothetical protein